MMNILFVSLGCDKNLVDSEVMLGLLSNKGYTFTDDETEADVIVVNTCCFIGDAKEESVNTILEMAEYRKAGKCKALIVTGCLAQRYKQEIIDEIPEVDAVLGTTTYDSIVEAIEQAIGGEHMLKCEDIDRLVLTPAKRMLTTGGHYAHLKIAEGCDKHCTYCIIPKLRGNYRSFPMERLVKEAEELAEQGVKELILVAQETTLYGTDLYGKKSLHLLLKELCKIKGIRWIRVQYCYPEEIYDELIHTIKEEPKVCHYLDLPIQHASDRILKRMGRRTSQADLRAIVANQIPEEVKEERRDEIMELQQEISFEKAEDMVGKSLWCMIEGKVADEYAYVARTYKDAPGVDGYLFVQTLEELMSGDFVKVKVTGADDYDLIGEIDDESAE